jgi:hypothetical protein
MVVQCLRPEAKAVIVTVIHLAHSPGGVTPLRNLSQPSPYLCPVTPALHEMSAPDYLHCYCHPEALYLEDCVRPVSEKWNRNEDPVSTH